MPHLGAATPGCSWPGSPVFRQVPGHQGLHVTKWFSPFLCRTRKMGSPRPSSSEKGKRKARSTGEARVPRSALCAPVTPPGFCVFSPLFTVFIPRAFLPTPGCLLRAENVTLLPSRSLSLVCTLFPAGPLARTQPPAISSRPSLWFITLPVKPLSCRDSLAPAESGPDPAWCVSSVQATGLVQPSPPVTSLALQHLLTASSLSLDSSSSPFSFHLCFDMLVFMWSSAQRPPLLHPCLCSPNPLRS